MHKLHLPFVALPKEFVTLLKSNLQVNQSSAPIFDVLRLNPALIPILENAFAEFDDGRGIEKVMLALGWANFRDRVASVYISKAIYGNFPKKTDMNLVEEIKDIEATFRENSTQSQSRTFLLCFYLKLAELRLQEKENNRFLDLKLPKASIAKVLNLSQGRSDKMDWLILLVLHFNQLLSEELVVRSLASGKKFQDLYQMMSVENRKLMHQNLLAYGASIEEPEPFLFERV